MAVTDVIARNVRRFREERHLSMAALGRGSGLAKQTIAAIESGKGNPTAETLENLATTLGVTVRALLTEMGTETLLQRGDAIQWKPEGALRVRHLDQVFGSGYVTNSVLQLEANRGPSKHAPGGRGALRHCYVLEGRVRLGPMLSPTSAKAGDFIRFPADSEHFFDAVTPVALLLVCTTAPQLSMSGRERTF
jgi:transcriptional regulator with XRE-family HTH domain